MPISQRWTTAIRPVFFSTNPWGIPDLMPVPGSLELPRRTAVQFEQSGPGALILDRTMKSRPGSTVAFFVDDYRLEPLWNWPRRTVRRL